MHKHVAPRRNPSPVVVVTMLALILGVILAGLSLISTQRPAQAQALITASEHAVVTPERVSVTTEPGEEPEAVQDWTPEAPQIPEVPVGAPEVGVPLTENVPYCEEDMPCWDCATMGNMVCGTIDDSAQAWAAWDANGGACLLNMDEARPFRVDYSASTPEYPQNMTATDVAVQGADGTWYVFHASYTDVPEETSHFEEPADMS